MIDVVLKHSVTIYVVKVIQVFKMGKRVLIEDDIIEITDDDLTLDLRDEKDDKLENGERVSKEREIDYEIFCTQILNLSILFKSQRKKTIKSFKCSGACKEYT